MAPQRNLPIGAEVMPDGGVDFRLWSTRAQSVELIIEEANGPAKIPLTPEPGCYFSAHVPEAGAGTRYRYRIDGRGPFPDPASRFQPDGPHGASEVIDPATFKWTDQDWRGAHLQGSVISELHLGTFTREGNWTAATARLEWFVDCGITVLEIMPVAEFPGDFGWGYDGVDLFAPTRLYGRPDDFRRFVNRAHELGLAVILDVVYNHLGPDGNYLREFAPEYFSRRYKTEWGEALNFDDVESGPVRQFVQANAAYWISEFHLDGLRLDATQQIFDSSEPHILAAINRSARESAGKRSIILIAENEPEDTRLVRPAERGGYGLDALWNDDFHHSARVALTGNRGAYYSDYAGRPQEFISAAKWGFLYQGQYYGWQKQRRGTLALDLSPSRFINFIENHDQVANCGTGERLRDLSSPARLRAMTALLLLGPWTPMLFQGQEFGSRSPFIYFAHHQGDLAKLVAAGRKEFLTQFPNLALPEAQDRMTPPDDAAAFARCKLDWSECQRNEPTVRLHRDLLRLRRTDFGSHPERPARLDGAVLGEACFVLRFFRETFERDRLLVVNFGPDFDLSPAPEPLLGPAPDKKWDLLWSSGHPEYGGAGTPPLNNDGPWRIPAETVLALKQVGA